MIVVEYDFGDQDCGTAFISYVSMVLNAVTFRG
jgi:hypothetical protein